MKRLIAALMIVGLVACIAGVADGAKFRPLGTGGRAMFDATHFVEITHADLTTTTTNTAQTLTNVMAVASNSAVALVAMVLDTAFSDTDAPGTNVDLWVHVGDGTDADLYMDRAQINRHADPPTYVRYGRSCIDTQNLFAAVSNVADTAATITTNVTFTEVPVTSYVPRNWLITRKTSCR